MTFLTQSLAFGTAGLPGVSANCSHMSSPVLVLDMHCVLPARHFACCADAGTPVASISDGNSRVTIERFVMLPPSSNDRRYPTRASACRRAGSCVPDWRARRRGPQGRGSSARHASLQGKRLPGLMILFGSDWKSRPVREGCTGLQGWDRSDP